jgi:NitT/TauT family transport system substrate-binding protein
MTRLGLEPAPGLAFDWIGGDPGQMQVQLAAGALDVGNFGAIGLATLAERGSDITLFGPALNNHGRWIVRGDSAYRKPSDLVGKRIATQPKTSETYQQARLAAALTGLDLSRDFEVIFGPPTANLALFERGDVDAVIVLEPTATRLVGAGAREIARVGDIWRQATGSNADPFLVGLAARRGWLDQNRDLASRIAHAFAAANAAITADPALLRTFHADMGLKDAETRAAALLPERMRDVYPTAWDADVWGVIDRQIDEAVKYGLLKTRPSRPLYDGRALAKSG